MVKSVVREDLSRSNARGAERALVLRYAPVMGRPALAAILSLDDALAQILRTTREPIVGQMRLVWWRDALERLDTAPAPAEPVLQALAGDVIPRGIGGGELSRMTAGWEALLGPAVLDEEAIEAHARERGGRLFSLAARALGADGDPAALAGEGWAMADLAGHLSNEVLAISITDRARDRLTRAMAHRWSRRGRALGALALGALADLDATPIGAPKRVARLFVHRLTGR